jgi:hypothetical protein
LSLLLFVTGASAFLNAGDTNGVIHRGRSELPPDYAKRLQDHVKVDMSDDEAEEWLKKERAHVDAWIKEMTARQDEEASTEPAETTTTPVPGSFDDPTFVPGEAANKPHVAFVDFLNDMNDRQASYWRFAVLAGFAVLFFVVMIVLGTYALIVTNPKRKKERMPKAAPNTSPKNKKEEKKGKKEEKKGKKK